MINSNRIASIVLALSIAASAFALSSARKAPELEQSTGTGTGVVNVNTATVAQLAFLPGVGPKLAAALAAARPFKSLEDLDKVKGIGPAKLASMSPFVVFTGQTTASAKIRVARAVSK